MLEVLMCINDTYNVINTRLRSCMKKAHASKKKKNKAPREYNNSVRSGRSIENRAHIIELYVNLLVEGNGKDVPLQALAKKSKTSMRTLFRFFGDKDSLNQEIENYLAQYLTSAADNLNMMKFEEYAEYTYKIFDQYERLFKAYLFTDFGQKSRILFRKKFNDMLVKKIQSELEISPSSDEAKKIYFIVSLINANIWKDIKDSFNLSGFEMSSSVKWAIELLLNNVKKKN